MAPPICPGPHGSYPAQAIYKCCRIQRATRQKLPKGPPIEACHVCRVASGRRIAQAEWLREPLQDHYLSGRMISPESNRRLGNDPQ